MGFDKFRDWVGIAVGVIPLLVASLAGIALYFDDKYVTNRAYERTQLSTDQGLKDLRVESGIQILENRRMILEERLVTIDLCASSPPCLAAFSGTEGLKTAKARTSRELDDVRAALSDWRKQKNGQ